MQTEGPPSGAGLLEHDVAATPQTSAGDGDHDRFAHYVRKEKIVESAVTGEPVTALCGKVWVPGRDPQRFLVCPTCKELHAGLTSGGDESSGDN